MKLGTGKATITPPVGTPLAGFGCRDHGSESVLDELEVRTFWFQNSDDPSDAVCIVTADLLAFGPGTTTYFRDAVAEKYGLPKERLLLAASHTHSGPHVEVVVIGTGKMVPEVRDMICERILAAIDDAHNSLQPVTLEAAKGVCSGFAVNRRVMRNGKAVMASNPSGPRDDQVTAVICKDQAKGDIRAVLFNFTCHPSTVGEYCITADYPGVARRHIEQLLGNGAVAAFLPGCCGNIRSNCVLIDGKTFRGGLPADIKVYGEALGDEVVRITRGETTPLTPKLNAKLTTLDLPLAGFPSEEELQDTLKNGTPVRKEWAASVLAQPRTNTRPFDIQRIDLADEATLVAMSGEVCVEYAHFVKSRRQNAFMIPMGYSNSVLSYIPTAEMFAEGGYEPKDSCLYYALPSQLTPDVESIIRKGIVKLLE